MGFLGDDNERICSHDINHWNNQRTLAAGCLKSLVLVVDALKCSTTIFEAVMQDKEDIVVLTSRLTIGDLTNEDSIVKPPIVPNLITLIRLIACIPLVGFFLNGNYTMALVTYTLQEFLDQLDGKIAMAFNWETTTGKFFDPFVDSMTHLTAFACLMTVQMVPLWIYLIFLFREAGLLFLRLLAALQGTLLGGHWAGKMKALIHAVVIFASLWKLGFGTTLLLSTMTWLQIAVAASLLSGLFYLFKYSSVLKRAFCHG